MYQYRNTVYKQIRLLCLAMLLPQEDVMFRYFVHDSSVIIGVLEEPFVDDGMATICVMELCPLSINSTPKVASQYCHIMVVDKIRLYYHIW